MKKEEKLKIVEKWEKRVGKASYIKFLKGGHITRQEAIDAKCYECEQGWSDGVQPCLISDCPLNPYHPYYGTHSKKKDSSS